MWLYVNSFRLCGCVCVCVCVCVCGGRVPIWSRLCHGMYFFFCIYLRTNNDLYHLQHKLIGFYNRDEKCLLPSTDWVFKLSSMRFVFKGLIKIF